MVVDLGLILFAWCHLSLVMFSLVWFGSVWYGLIRYGLVWLVYLLFSSVCFVSFQFNFVWFGLVEFGIVWFDMAVGWLRSIKFQTKFANTN